MKMNKKKSVLFILLSMLCLGAVWITARPMQDYSKIEQTDPFYKLCSRKINKQLKQRRIQKDMEQEYGGEYKISLDRYIYDGISVYAIFAIRTKGNQDNSLNQFGTKLSEEQARFCFGSNKQANIREEAVMEREEKNVCLQTNLFSIQNNNVEADNILYMFDRTNNVVQLSFPLRVNTPYFEGKSENFMVRLSRLQLFYYGKKKNTLRDVTVYYTDGRDIALLKNYRVIEESLGTMQTEVNASGRVSFYEVRKEMNFDEMEKVEIKLSTGEDITLEKSEIG